MTLFTFTLDSPQGKCGLRGGRVAGRPVGRDSEPDGDDRKLDRRVVFFRLLN